MLSWLNGIYRDVALDWDVARHDNNSNIKFVFYYLHN